MAKQPKKPKRSKDDKKSNALAALEKYADKILVGEEASNLFNQADKLPLNLDMQMAPIRGFRNPIPNPLTAAFIAKSGAYADAASKTNIGKLFGTDAMMRLAGPSRSLKSTTGDVASLASMFLPFTPAKKMLGKSKDWLALLNSWKALTRE